VNLARRLPFPGLSNQTTAPTITPKPHPITIIATIAFLLFYFRSLRGKRSLAAKFPYDFVLLWKILHQRDCGRSRIWFKTGKKQFVSQQVELLDTFGIECHRLALLYKTAY
jgi:hypothetical protein